VAGYVFSALMPVIGLLIGFALMIRGERRAVDVMASAVIFSFVWYVVLVNEGLV
jgi:hypothetical protein